MKRSYPIIFSLFAIVGLGIVPGVSRAVEGFANLQFTPSLVHDKESFTISLARDIDPSVPDGASARLWINTNEDGLPPTDTYKDFGIWVTVGELKNGLTRTMNCKAYASYEPGQIIDVTGKILRQKVYLTVEGTSFKSDVADHTKDCRVLGGGGGGGGAIEIKSLKLLPDFKDANGTYPNMGSASAHILNVNQAGLTLDLMSPYSSIAQNENGGQCDAGDKTCQNLNGGKGNNAGPRLFSLSDPMNPTVIKSKNWDINTGDDAYGDFGPYLSVEQGVAFSADGAYSAALDSQEYLFFYRNSNKIYHRAGKEGFSDFAGIIQSGGNTYFVGNSRIINMTDFDTLAPDVHKPMPPNTPQISFDGQFDRSIVLGDMFAHYKLGALGGKSGGTGTPTLSLYSFAQSSPLAEINLPIGIQNCLAGGPQYVSVSGFVTPDGLKYVILCGGSYIYKVNAAGTGWIPIVEGANLGSVSSAVGVIMNGSRALMTFTSDAGVGKPHIYLLSALAQTPALIKDIAPASQINIGPVVAAATYFKGNAAYVYTASNAPGGHDILVWTLSGSAGGGGGGGGNHYSCTIDGSCVVDANGPYTTSNCNNLCAGTGGGGGGGSGGVITECKPEAGFFYYYCSLLNIR